MNNFASFFGLGVPELMFLVGVVVIAIVVVVVVRNVIKGYRKGTSENKQ